MELFREMEPSRLDQTLSHRRPGGRDTSQRLFLLLFLAQQKKKSPGRGRIKRAMNVVRVREKSLKETAFGGMMI